MKEYKLGNGQVIEFTKEGVLIKGNAISLRGDIDIIRDNHAVSISEIFGNSGSNNVIDLDEEEKASVTKYASGNIYQLPDYEYFEDLNLFVFHFKSTFLDSESKRNVQAVFERLLGDGVKVLILDEMFGG